MAASDRPPRGGDTLPHSFAPSLAGFTPQGAFPGDVADVARGVADRAAEIARAMGAAGGATRDSLAEVAYEFLPGGRPSGWHVQRFVLREAVSELYELTLDLANEDLTASPDELFGARCVVTLARGDFVVRRYGEVRRVARLGVTNSRTLARVELAPVLRRLAHRSDARVFQGLTAVDVVAQVLAGHGLYARTLVREVRRSLPRREYCVQYHESDLAFVMRLLEEEGVTLSFRHDEHEDGEQLVLSDQAEGLPRVPTLDGRAAPVTGFESPTLPVESVRFFDPARASVTTGTTLRDHDWTRPALDLTRSHPGSPGARSTFEYPAGLAIGGYRDPTYTEDDGDAQARIRQESREAAARRGTARTNLIGALPGAVLEIAGHNDPSLDGRHLVLRAVHTGVVPDAILGTTQHDDGARDRYHNELECIPAEVPYAPERRAARTGRMGMQTATVVGPEGEEIYTDEHGRVKVRFHWDRQDNRERSSCWVRVMQTWAGPGWGSVFIPRVGMEVVVNFLEGDPDRPLVIGCLYNGVNRPPYELPDEKTKSTTKSSSSPGGRGFNELRFEDRAGAEEVFVHAQRDMNERVLHDHSTSVGRNESNSVGGNQSNTVAGNRTEVVRRNETVTVQQSREVTVVQSDTLIVGENHTVIVGSTGTWSPPAPGGGMHVTGEWNVEATEKIVLKVGGSSVTITPSGVDVVSAGAATVVGKQFVGYGTASATVSSSGTTTVSGTPVQLNGPGPFAGRVTELAPATITTGAALVLVGGASFPYPVTKLADGTLQVGDHIRISPSEGRYEDFQGKVLRDLGIMSQTPDGAQRLENIQNNPGGHDLTIREYSAAEENDWGANNSLCYPGAGQGDPNALGYDADGNPVPGPGSDTTIAYNPDIVGGPDGSAPPDATLFHEMGHAEHNVYGTNRQWEETHDGWENQEEWQTIQGGVNRPGGSQIPGVPETGSENSYYEQRGYPYRRTDHGNGYVDEHGNPVTP